MESNINNEKKIPKNVILVLPKGPLDQVLQLNDIGIEPKVISIDIKDDMPTTLPPAQFVEQTTAERALGVVKLITDPFDVIIACDTIVVVDDEIIGKPKDAEDALAILKRLNNRWHSVFSGVTLIAASQEMEKFHVETKVKFGDIPEQMFREYIRSGECFNRAGAYCHTNKSTAFVEIINGSYSNITGLPVNEILQRIWKLGTSQPNARQHVSEQLDVQPPLQHSNVRQPLDHVSQPIVRPSFPQLSVRQPLQNPPQNVRQPLQHVSQRPSVRQFFPQQIVGQPLQNFPQQPIVRPLQRVPQQSNVRQPVSQVSHRPNVRQPLYNVPPNVRQPLHVSQQPSIRPVLQQPFVRQPLETQARPKFVNIKTGEIVENPQLPPTNEYTSTFYRSSGVPGASDWLRVGLKEIVPERQREPDLDDW